MNCGLDFFKIKQRLIAEGRRFAVATIAAESVSSLHQETATTSLVDSRIIVAEDDQVFGTTGDAELDEAITRGLREVLRGKESNSIGVIRHLSGIQSESHGKSEQALRVLFERFDPVPKLVIIGAGEVGLAVARLAADLDFRIVIVDERGDLANRQRFPMADSILCEPDLLQALSFIDFDEFCYIVIAFQANDDRAIRYCLNQSWAYCGMLGSKKRIETAWETLKSEGVSAERLGAVHAPIGFDIGAQTPQEIAIAILAEVLAIRNRKE